MLKDIITIKSELADEIPINFIEIAGLFIHYKRVTFSAYSYTSLLYLVHITESLYYFIKNLKDVVNYKND